MNQLTVLVLSQDHSLTNSLKDARGKLQNQTHFYETISALQTSTMQRLNGLLADPTQTLVMNGENQSIKQELRETQSQLDMERENHNR